MSALDSPRATLHRWAVEVGGDRYTAPELRRTRIRADHPGGKVGVYIVTSSLTGSEGRLVRTSSGSVYRLGRVHPRYRRWLRRHGIAYDPRQPVKVTP